MLQKVEPGRAVRKKDFLKFLDSEQKKQLLAYARDMEKKKVVHVNATAKGGGVAELLKSFVPYAQALGVDVSWYVLRSEKAGKAFFDLTNRLHNALQGSRLQFSREDWKRYAKVNKEVAGDLEKKRYDIVVIHDPQPLAAIRFLRKNLPALSVLHLDTSSPDRLTWENIQGFLQRYDRTLFSNTDFVNKGLPKEKVRIVAPAIDPLALKQTIVSSAKARAYLASYGIPEDCPLIVQVSRFDAWKNPYGFIEAFWLLGKKYPKAVLLLVGFKEARDNPHAEKVYRDVRTMAGKHPRIFLFFHPRRIGGAKFIEEFTMMAQNAADIVVQNSVKEGFGLTLTEAMWKEKPVIGGPASGIRRQITEGENGYVVRNARELAERIIYLFEHRLEGERLGKAAKESVRKNFLLPRYVLDHLRIYQEVLE